MKEKWKEVSGFDGLYFVSNDGQIKSAKTGMIRKLTPDRDGYLTELG
ncbi:NUMOD4 domain-containing protein, partial [Enterococcus faecium]